MKAGSTPLEARSAPEEEDGAPVGGGWIHARENRLLEEERVPAARGGERVAAAGGGEGTSDPATPTTTRLSAEGPHRIRSHALPRSGARQIRPSAMSHTPWEGGQSAEGGGSGRSEEEAWLGGLFLV